MNDTVTRGQIQVSVRPITLASGIEMMQYEMDCAHGGITMLTCNDASPDHYHVETTPGQRLLRCWMEWARLTSGICRCQLPETINARFEV